MHRGARIAVVMPAYNVRRHLRQAVLTVPSFVDDLIVVDDGSDDRTDQVLRNMRRPGLVLIRHNENRGVGAAISTGYSEALARGAQVLAVMAGDGQMDPADLPALLDPVVTGVADYAKGDRFQHADVWRVMPLERVVGNVILSLLTKLSSGYLQIFDSQCGYTAISRDALLALNGEVFAGYGYLNDQLARLRTVGARVVDVPVRAVYEGQPSGIRLRTVAHPILTVLVGSLARRLLVQHVAPLLGEKTPRLSSRIPAWAVQPETPGVAAAARPAPSAREPSDPVEGLPLSSPANRRLRCGSAC